MTQAGNQIIMLNMRRKLMGFKAHACELTLYRTFLS